MDAWWLGNNCFCLFKWFGLFDSGNNFLAEFGQFIREVKESRQYQVYADGIQLANTFDNLFVGANKTGFEAVIILDQIIKVGVGPHAFTFRCRLSGLLDLFFKTFNSFFSSIFYNIFELLFCFSFRFPSNDKGVDADFRGVLFQTLWRSYALV